MSIPTFNAPLFQAQNPQSIIPQDSSPLWQNLANIGFQIRENANVQEAVKQGAVDQDKAGTAYVPDRTGFLGIQRPSDAQGNNARDKTFLFNKNTELRNKVRDLAEANKMNPQAFDDGVEEFRGDYFNGIPEHLVPGFRSEFENSKNTALSQIKGNRLEFDRRTYAATFADEFKALSGQLRSAIEQDPNDPRVVELQTKLGGMLTSAQQPTNEGIYLDPALAVGLANGMLDNMDIGKAVHDYNKLEGFGKRRDFINDVVTGKAYKDITSEGVRDQITRELRERYNVDQQQYTEARASLTHEIGRATQALESGLGTNLNIGGLPQRMAKLGFNTEQINETMLNLRQAQSINNEVTINRSLSLPDLRSKVEQQRVSVINPTGSDQERLTNAKLYEVNARLYEQISTAVKSDPYRALQLYRPQIAARYDLSKEEGVIAARQAIQQQFGVTTPPIAPPTVIQSVKQTLDQATNADQAVMVVESIQRNYPQLAPAILEEAGLDSEKRLAVRSYLAGQAHEGTLIWNAIRNQSNNKKGLSEFKQEMVVSAFEGEFGREFFKSNPSERSDYYKAFEALYVEGLARGVSNPERYASKVLKNTGSVLEVGNVKLIGPVGTVQEKVQSAFNSIGTLPEVYGVYLGDPNNTIQTPTLADFRRDFSNREYMIARDGERFVIVNNQGQRLLRETPTGTQPLYIDKMGNVDMPTVDANIRRSEIFERAEAWDAASMPSPTQKVQRVDPRMNKDLTFTKPVSADEFVRQITTKAQEKNLPADPLANSITIARDQRQDLSAISNFIAANKITPQIAEYLSKFEEFSVLGKPAQRDLIVDTWNNSSVRDRRRVGRHSGRELSPLQSLLIIARDVQARPIELPQFDGSNMGGP